MIKLYSGTPGSGKSYHVIGDILLHLWAGKRVIANFPMRFTKREKRKGYEKRFTYCENQDLTIEFLIEYAIDNDLLSSGREGQCLVVIDEAGGRFNSREFQKSDRRFWIDFFSQHRKLSFDFILVTQNDRMLDRQIRGFIEYEIMHRVLNNYGVFWFLPMKVFVCVEYWYQIKERLGAEYKVFHKKTADHYDHMAMFSGFTISPQLLEKIQAARSGRKVELPPEINQPVDAIYNDDSGE